MRKWTIIIPIIAITVLLAIAGTITIAGSGSAPATAESAISLAEDLKLAETLKNEGKYEQAELIYLQILTERPDTEDAFQAQEKLICLYIKQDMQEQERASFEQLIAAFSGSENLPQCIYQIAEAARGYSKHEKAKGYYARSIVLYPS